MAVTATNARALGFTPTEMWVRLLRCVGLYGLGFQVFGQTYSTLSEVMTRPGCWVIGLLIGMTIWTVGFEWAQGYPDFLRMDDAVRRLNEGPEAEIRSR